MKIFVISTMGFLLITFLSGMDNRNRDSMSSWVKLKGSDGRDINVDSYGRFTLVNTVGKFYNYEGPEWKEEYWYLPSPKRQVQLAAENVGIRIKSVDFTIWASPKVIRGADGRYYPRLEWDTIVKPVPVNTVFKNVVSRDIAINTDSTIWRIDGHGRIGCLKRSAYNNYYSYVNPYWQQHPGIDGSRIAAGGGQVWAISTAGKIYRHRNPKDVKAGWEQMTGSDGRDITVSNDGQVFLVNTVGYIYQWGGNKWIRLDGSDGLRIAANKGKIALINTDREIYTRNY